MNFLSEACSTLESGIAEVRQVSHDLLPVTLESFGLMQALEEWIEPLRVDPNFTINFKHNGTARRLLPTIELGLLRVIQELVQNTLVHAEATSITFAVAFNNDRIEVTYSDNGKGFDSDLHQPGLGIKNMQSRILALGGTIQFNPVRTGGFSAQFNVPTP